MKAITNSLLVTAREAVLQEHKHSHQIKLAKMSAVNPWLSPAVIIPAIVLSAQFGPSIFRAGKQAISNYRQRRVTSYIEKTMSEA